MREIPILFNGAMVRAILAGEKTQTRRLVKPQPPEECSIHYMLGDESWLPEESRKPLRHFWEAWGGPLFQQRPKGHLCGSHTVHSPYGRPGDRLWVRETFWAFGVWVTRFSEKKGRDEWHFEDMTAECDQVYRYDADSPDVLPANRPGCLPGWHKRPAIFMPRHASRITLENAAVRIERLQDISESDTRAEGTDASHCFHDGGYCKVPEPYKTAFAGLWAGVYGADNWRANPWVWVVEFRRVEAPQEAAHG